MTPLSSPTASSPTAAMTTLIVRCLSMLLLCTLAVCPFAANATPSIPAQLSTQAFYKWYLQELAVDRDPLSDRPQQYEKHVAKGLVGDINKAMTSEDGIDSDYFLKAQDYLDDWRASVNTSVVSQRSTSAVILVKLGRDKETIRRLKVSLIVEDGAWKIRKVRLA